MERKQQCPSSYFFPTLPNQEVEKASGDDDTYAPLSGKKLELSHHFGRKLLDIRVLNWTILKKSHILDPPENVGPVN